MNYFERDDDVLVRTAAGNTEKGTVVLDTGDNTIVVTRNDEPSLSRRVARADVAVLNGARRGPAPLAPKKKPPPIDMSKLKCVQTEHGWCSLQLQARPVTRAELAEGVWTTCGTWAETRSKPTRRRPDCKECCKRLKI